MWFPGKLALATPKYDALVRAIEAAILDGTLRRGERLAPQREFAYQLNIAVEVVTRAFKIAEARGLIVSKVGRGTFVLSFPEVVLATDSEPSDLIDLRSNTTMIAPFNEALNSLLGSISRRKSLHGLLEYHHGAGLEPHRAAGAAWIAQRGVNFSADEVIMTDGARDAMLMILAGVSEGGGSVLVENLRFPGFRRLSELFRLKLRGVAMDDQGFIPADGLAKAREGRVSAIFCAPICHDVTNASMSLERRQAVVDLARELDCLLIEDDSGGYLPADPVPTFSALAPERTIYMTGTNRYFATGVRIGFVAMREPVLKRLKATTDVLSWTSSALLGEIAASLITGPYGEKLITWHRKDAANRQQLAREILYLPAANGPRESSSNHLWVPMRPGQRGNDIAAELEDRGVAVLPSSEFAVDDGPVPEAIRICFGGVRELQRLKEGLGIIAETLAR